MTGPLLDARHLVENPLARSYHEEGKRVELSGDFETAHGSYAQARAVMTNTHEIAIDGIVQLARINRDDGFTYVREAIATSRAIPLNYARRELTKATEATASLISGAANTPLPMLSDAIGRSAIKHRTPKRARREIFAEHGATVSLLGRFATVNEVVFDNDQIDTLGTQAYGLAHEYLRIGNNGYYRVSNAMAGARQERLDRRLAHMAVWLGRAAYGMVWTTARNPRNLISAGRTFVSRGIDLRSYPASIRSVTTRP